MNVQTLIKDLNQHGLSDNAIARRTGASQATISRIRNGTSGGRLTTANKINQLHQEVIAKDCHEPASN